MLKKLIFFGFTETEKTNCRKCLEPSLLILDETERLEIRTCHLPAMRYRLIALAFSTSTKINRISYNQF